MPPLSDITVVALEQAVAAPLATRHLADLGARVIKIERPGAGDFARGYDRTVRGLSSHFVWLNRSKRSLTLDLKKDGAVEILHQLLAAADVFVHNLAPGAVDRLGFGAARVRGRYPRLIACEISGYGSAGPYRDHKAYDLLVQSEVGLVSITGTEDTPCKVGISIADIAAGMYAYSGILTALIARGRTGAGASLEVSLFDALGEWMSYPAYYTMYGGSAPPRTGASHATIAPYGPFAAGDGHDVYLGLQNDREWQRFCDVVLRQRELASDPRFDSNERRVEHRDALGAIIERVFAGMSAAEALGRLAEAQIATARLNSVREFVDHPQLAARDRWRDVGSPAGPLRALLPPVTMSDVDPVMDPIPALGDHTEAILAELGYDAASIDRFRAEGVV